MYYCTHLGGNSDALLPARRSVNRLWEMVRPPYFRAFVRDTAYKLGAVPIRICLWNCAWTFISSHMLIVLLHFCAYGLQSSRLSYNSSATILQKIT